jgi:hypothetical protein
MRRYSLGVIFMLASSVRAETVLHIGDSLSVGKFGSKLNDFFVAKGDKTYSYASCGSAPFWWTAQRSYSTPCGYFEKGPGTPAVRRSRAQTPKLARLLDLTNPSTVVVQQGTNLLTERTFNEAFVRQEIRKLRDQLRGRRPAPRLIWVGPPDAADRKISDAHFRKFYEILKAELRPPNEIAVDSWVEGEYPNGLGDGLHFSGRALGEKENAWIERVKTAVTALPPREPDATATH